MILIGDLWFPDGEDHFTNPKFHPVEDYQRPQRDKALKYVTDFSLAIDVGAHVGIFSRHFAQQFERVLAFEPTPRPRECLERNVPDNVEIVPSAVSDFIGTCEIYVGGNAGGSFISNDPRVDQPDVEPGEIISAPVTMIDALGLDRLGLLKIDAQGSDHLVLYGARDTILRCRPVVLVEEKPIGGPTGSIAHFKVINDFLLSLGAKRRAKVGADVIYTLKD